MTTSFIVVVQHVSCCVYRVVQPSMVRSAFGFDSVVLKCLLLGTCLQIEAVMICLKFIISKKKKYVSCWFHPEKRKNKAHISTPTFIVMSSPSGCSLWRSGLHAAALKSRCVAGNRHGPGFPGRSTTRRPWPTTGLAQDTPRRKTSCGKKHEKTKTMPPCFFSPRFSWFCCLMGGNLQSSHMTMVKKSRLIDMDDRSWFMMTCLNPKRSKSITGGSTTMKTTLMSTRHHSFCQNGGFL